MGTLFGRDAELARGRVVLDSAARDHIVRAIRIVGSSGVGKTALAEALAQEAAAGWLVVWAPSFRIHASLPLLVARRVAQALVETLGDNAARYTSGLTLERDRPDDFAEAFLRIVEGVTLDHRLLIVLDDAQWADAESRALIERTVTALADRAIVLLSTERSDDQSESAFTLVDQAIALGDLSLQAAIAVARAIYPSANDDVAMGIASETRGRAADIVAVATAARESGAMTLREVSANTRRVVARDLALLDPKVREFLQICAVIDEPIDFVLLQQLWDPHDLVALIAACGRYMTSSEDGLRFAHATVMESILETIPIEIPLRHRVIDALRKLPAPRLEDYERMAAQSAACGDHEFEREALIKLSETAAGRAMLPLAATALERALALASPKTDELIPTYVRLSQMYNAMGREAEAIFCCRRALAEAEVAGVSAGVGAIAASIALAQCHIGLAAEGRATIDRYAEIVTSDAERASLFSVGEIIAMHRFDLESAEHYRQRFERVAAKAETVVAIRHHVANAFLALRSGDERGALEQIRSADTAAAFSSAMYGVMPLAAKIYHTIRYRGVAAAEGFLAQLGPQDRSAFSPGMLANLMIARGEFVDVAEHVADKLPLSTDSSMRRILLNARYTAAALQNLSPTDPAWELAHQDVAAFEAGERTPMAMPVVVAALTPLAMQSPGRAKKLLTDAIAALGQPTDTSVFLYPVLLASAARTLEARDALDAIASGAVWSDKQPWNLGHVALARGVAAAALGRADSESFLIEACDRLAPLGVTYFAELAAKTLGATKPTTKDRSRPSNTTRREVEIAALVAEGLTNREIAERLVLSERTVEGHIANLFAKVNVNSRTQLATWFMRASSVAS